MVSIKPSLPIFTAISLFRSEQRATLAFERIGFRRGDWLLLDNQRRNGMRKIIPFVLILATAMGAIAVQEAAAKGGDNGRGGRGGGESMGSREHVYTHYQNPNFRYRKGKVLCTVKGTSGMVYEQDLRGWRRVPSCSGRYFFD